MLNLKVFAKKHKKLLLYGGAGVAGYIVLWPQVANFITQSQGAIANPPGSPSPPAYVPIYTGTSPTPPPPTALPGLVAGWTNIFYNDPSNPTGGAHFADNTPVVKAVSGSPDYVPIADASGYGHIGSIPTAAATAASVAAGNGGLLSKLTPTVSHAPVTTGTGMGGN